MRGHYASAPAGAEPRGGIFGASVDALQDTEPATAPLTPRDRFVV